MSSFGSNGSTVGVAVSSRRGTSSIPKPVARSLPAGVMSRAARRRSSSNCVFSSSGRTVQAHASAAATIGAEKLVPLAVPKPDSERLSGSAMGMSVPGATTSMARERDEKLAARPSGSVAPTVTTWGRLAGYEAGLPRSPSLPEAATRIVPRAKTSATISASRFERGPPRLTLTMPGPRAAACSSPAMTSALV